MYFLQFSRNMIDKKPWNCSVCQKSFMKFSQLTKHREEHQVEESMVDNNSTQNYKNAKSEKSKYKCKVCQGMFPDKSLLVTHSCAGRPTPRIFKCKTCPKEFLYMCKLVQHEKIHVMDKPYKCDVCYCSFAHACHLGRHMMTHSASANTKCIVCSKVFKNSDQLQKHKLIHNGERVFKCDLCPQTFTDLSQLTTHLNGHADDQKVSFEDNTQYSQVETLATKSTTSLRPKAKKRSIGISRKLSFRSCRAKDLVVESSNRSKRHNIFKAIQKNLEMSSECQETERSVTNSGHVAKSNLKKTTFHCDICNKAFSTKEEFETHHKLHAMEERQEYVCKICHQYFFSSSLYELHVKDCHQEKKILPNAINGQYMPRPSLFEKFDNLSSPSEMFHSDSNTQQSTFLLNLEENSTLTNCGADPGTADFLLKTKSFDNFKCLICNENFSSSFTLDLHLEKHIIVKTLPRNRHTTWSIHFPQKKFSCQICQKSFSQRMILQSHSRIMHRDLNGTSIE